MHWNRTCTTLSLAVLAIAWSADRVSAHCDSIEGPVAKDARVALDTGDVTPVLKWVSKGREAEIREAFQRTMAVRGTGDDVRALADTYFLETLVRVHRTGEGEPYTGLKPAASVDPGIAAADQALRAGSVNDLAKHVSAEIALRLQERFASALERRKHAADGVDAGRDYVAAYVDYIHFVEALHRLVSEGSSQHAHGH